MYYEGQGVKQDYTQAKYWWGQAAQQGVAEAQFGLATLYELEQGVRQNYATAKKWYKKACDNGDQDACDKIKELQQKR